MLRDQLNHALKDAMKVKDMRRTATLRLILAALKDRDIAARTGDRPASDQPGISDDEIMQMLQTMVRQRRDSIALYEQGGRQELADQEREEIAIIEGFLPRQMSDDEIRSAVKGLVQELGASSVKDMGRVMGQVKARYAGQMDFAKASAIVKEVLSG